MRETPKFLKFPENAKTWENYEKKRKKNAENMEKFPKIKKKNVLRNILESWFGKRSEKLRREVSKILIRTISQHTF
jgi:hypothetical protein